MNLIKTSKTENHSILKYSKKNRSSSTYSFFIEVSSYANLMASLIIAGFFSFFSKLPKTWTVTAICLKLRVDLKRASAMGL